MVLCGLYPGGKRTVFTHQVQISYPFNQPRIQKLSRRWGGGVDTEQEQMRCILTCILCSSPSVVCGSGVSVRPQKQLKFACHKSFSPSVCQRASGDSGCTSVYALVTKAWLPMRPAE